MSYNSYNTTINNSIIPYIDSTVEVGYFAGIGATTSNNPIWYSQQAVVQTNHGIATVATDQYGLNIINPGIYRLTVSVDLYKGGGAGNSNTIQFAFGTSKLSGASGGTIVNLLGGNNSFYTKAISPSNPAQPGFITWIVSSSSETSTALGKFTYTGNQIFYDFFNKAASSPNAGTQLTGMLTTEIVISTNTANSAIYLNVAQDNGQWLDRSYFVLNMLSTTPIITS